MLRNLNQSSGGRRILGVPNVGILAATISSQTATGDNGAGLLYDESINPVNAGKQLRLVVTSPPSAGVFFAYENGSFDFSGAPDGSYSIGYNVLADNDLFSSDTAPLLVGVVNASASAGTGTSTGSGTGGDASTSGGANASADAGTGTSVGSGTGGDASGGTSGVINGSASAGTGTSYGSGSGGNANNGSYTRAPSGSGPLLIYPKSSRPSNTGGRRH